MLSWKRIFCAVDFSPPSRRALRVAADLAARVDAKLTVLHVRDVPSVPIAELAAAPPPDAVERARYEAARLLESARLEAEALAPGRVAAELLEGEPAWEVVKYAASRGADLLVVGTHGRTGVRRFMMGSIAERVLREAPCPVLAVREPAAEVVPD
jgi:nucleotide-binding universal stress UspA family protein